MTNERKPTGGSANENELARLLVDQGLATPQEIQQCLDIQRHGSDPNHRSLSGILVANGMVTTGQLARLKKTVEVNRKGQQIPGYKILGKLGAGAMATVFKARQLSLDRIVAIKVLPKQLSENAEYVERFYKEGQAAAKLNHPNIVQAIDVGEAGGYHYFVMEYVEGQHASTTSWPPARSSPRRRPCEIIIQIAKALEHAHERGFIHRDVKPKNIMITQDGVAKLADMGLARAASDIEAAQAEAGRAFGTPYYISPEQIRGEVDIDFRADIYSPRRDALPPGHRPGARSRARRPRPSCTST